MTSKSVRLSVRLVAVLAVMFLAWFATLFGPRFLSTPSVSLQFVCHTNTPEQGSFVLMEITNRSDVTYYFGLRSTGKSGSGVLITQVIETDGNLLPINAKSRRREGQSSYKIGADAVKSGDKVWATITHDPKTSAERQREWVSYWCQRIGLKRFGAYLGEGRPTHGILLPGE